MMTQIFEISRSVMDVEWRRLEVIAQNLANAGTTRTPDGRPYQPMRLVSGPSLFPVDKGPSSSETSRSSRGVRVYGYESMNVSPRLVYEPSHPHADPNGFVAYPGIDHASEMSLMVKTLRVYEANVVSFNAARNMYLKAMELGSKT